jgi:hypothetical protein
MLERAPNGLALTRGRAAPVAFNALFDDPTAIFLSWRFSSTTSLKCLSTS